MTGRTTDGSRLILVVDDDEPRLSLLMQTLKGEGYRVECAKSGGEALGQLSRLSPHLVLLDTDMPDLDGDKILQCLRRRRGYVSVIFVSERDGTEDIVRGLDAGADDYVCKPFEPRELLARVRAQLRIKDLNDQLAAANRSLQQLVDIDDLTGLYNMRSIYLRIENELARARRFGRSVGVVMLDLDDFKMANDNHDHLFGSYVLSKVGQLIHTNIRQIDFAARYGGDEFLIVLTETTVEGAIKFSERLRHIIESQLFQDKGAVMQLTASIGVALSGPLEQQVDARGLVRAADKALYAAKRTGKNRIRLTDALARIVASEPSRGAGSEVPLK